MSNTFDHTIIIIIIMSMLLTVQFSNNQFLSNVISTTFESDASRWLEGIHFS